MPTRRIFLALACAFGVALVLTATTQALTRRHDVAVDDMHAFGVSFRSVGWIEAPTSDGTFIRYCSAVLVQPDIAITAAHCVTGQDREVNVKVNQTVFNLGNFRTAPQVRAQVASIEVSSGWACEDCELGGIDNAGWDVAVLRFNTILHNPALSRIYVGDMVGHFVAVVGYGRLSTGLEAFDDFGASAQDGRKMAGTNIVDRVDDFGPEANRTYAWLFDFDSPDCDKPWVSTVFGPAISDPCPTDMEASYGSGDSGGPMFVLVNDEWMLAGVASSILALDGLFGTYGQVAFVSNLTLEENRELLAASGLLDNALIATPTPTPTLSPTTTPTPTHTASSTPSPTSTSTPTPSPTASPTATSTPFPTVAPTASSTPVPEPTAAANPDTPTAVTELTAPAQVPAAAGSCKSGGAADGALLLLPLGMLLMVLRRFRYRQERG